MPDEVAELRPITLFYSYSHKDEKLRNELATHLAMLKHQGLVKEWYDRRIAAGEEWEDAIDEYLESANVILLLVSANFIASDYCWGKEMTRALERHNAGEAYVIPIIIRPVDWSGAPFGKLLALPKNARPVTLWDNRDAAWVDVAKSIRKQIEMLAALLSTGKPTSDQTIVAATAAQVPVQLVGHRLSERPDRQLRRTIHNAKNW